MSLPKVLVLNQPFVSDTGGGITLSNLFSGWNKDNLAVACMGYIISPHIDPNICNNYYQLGHKERKWIFPLSLVTRKYYSGPIEFTKPTENKVMVKASKTRHKAVMNYINPFFDFTGVKYFMTKTKLSDDFCKWLDDYKPDVIYAQCSSRESILFCIAVQKYLKKPNIFHMMDDWPSLVGVKGFMKKYWQKTIDREFRALLDVSDMHLAICDYMGEEYKERYGKNFKTFHNPIDLDFWQRGQKNNYELGENPFILYAGRIGLGIESALKTIAQAVEKVNNELNISLRFVIQAQEAPSWTSNYKHVEYKPFVPYEQLPYEFGTADFLILPYDFSPKSLAYIQYSMPTKASEYMASGVPILIYAPEHTALVQYAKKDKWAELVTVPKVEILADKLQKLVTDSNYREKIAQTAKNTAKERHDKAVVTRSFQKILVDASQNSLP